MAIMSKNFDGVRVTYTEPGRCVFEIDGVTYKGERVGVGKHKSGTWRVYLADNKLVTMVENMTLQNAIKFLRKLD